MSPSIFRGEEKHAVSILYSVDEAAHSAHMLVSTHDSAFVTSQ